MNGVRRAGKGGWLAARGQKPDQGRTRGFGPSRERLHSEVVEGFPWATGAKHPPANARDVVRS